MTNVTDITRTIRTQDYELGHSEWELKRLTTQAKLVDPITRQYFKTAGIAPGMRVLDVGSGAGDVAFLAAELVGPTGSVVGADRSPTAVATARARALERKLGNVMFQEGDPTLLSFEQVFDAVVGRYVLMFNPDPVSIVKGLARHLRPSGIIVFHEVDWTGVRSNPPAPLYDRCCVALVETFCKVGTNAYMGLRLHSAFVEAGLPAPDMAVHALAGGGESIISGIDMIADLVVTMAPVMELHGVATVADIAPATLKARMRAEARANGSVVVGRYEVGAWSRIT